MNKLFVTLLIVSFQLAASAQTIFFEDFESYAGGVIPTCDIWSSWSGDPGSGDGIIVTDGIVIDNQSGYIGPDSFQDVLMNLQNQQTGDYTLRWEMYISAGSTGYFNIQGMTGTDPITGCLEPGNGGSGIFNSSNLYFNNSGGSPGVFEDQTTGETGSYPEDVWFTVSIYFDMISSPPTYEISIEDVPVNLNPVPFQTDEVLGAINFYSIDSQNNYWLDNIIYIGGDLGTEDIFSPDNFSISPNPVVDVLQIQSMDQVDRILIYDIKGSLVASETPKRMSPNIDLSNLDSGVYLVTVTVGDASKTFKIVK
ncbi:MAG: T9SS type A sorting domain-containing protein [Bacteroidota bacterium]